MNRAQSIESIVYGHSKSATSQTHKLVYTSCEKLNQKSKGC